MTGAGAAPLLRLEGITRRFPGVVANDDVALDLHGGEVHALLGENGAGKSTLIAILSGVLRPDAGRILIEGREVAMASPRDAIARGIGTVPQHPSPVPTLTVVENLMLGEPWWRTLPRGAARARLREIGAAFGVALDPDVAAGALSPVQAQQLGLVRALWHAPRVLVLDEPAAVPGAADLARMLDRLRAAGLAVLLVTHRLPDVLACADRVTVLRQGRVSGGIAPAERRALPEGEVATRILGMMFGPQPDTAAPSRRAPPGGLAPVLEVEDLSTRPDGARSGLDQVSLTLWPGEVLGIAGLEGQGQRALAEALAGQAVPEAGRIRLGGGDVTALGVAARAALGLRHVTDDRLGEGIVAPFSLALNLLLKRVGAPPFWRGGVQDETAIRRHAEALIARHDIRAPGPATPAGRLSGGNIQKAILARELDEGARVVVLNRPTHGLDHAATQATHRRIREAAEAGVGLLLISAEIEELLLLCDRIIVLSRGRVAGEVANAPGAGARIGALIAA